MTFTPMASAAAGDSPVVRRMIPHRVWYSTAHKTMARTTPTGASANSDSERSNGTPSHPRPKTPAKPSPNIVSASPETYWLARSPIETTAWSRAADSSRDQQPEDGRSRNLGGGEGTEGTQDHHSFHPEIDHAGALCVDLAQCAPQQGRAKGCASDDRAKQPHGEIHLLTSRSRGGIDVLHCMSWGESDPVVKQPLAAD